MKPAFSLCQPVAGSSRAKITLDKWRKIPRNAVVPATEAASHSGGSINYVFRSEESVKEG